PAVVASSASPGVVGEQN
ncbi:hypothetical protein A2U01_0104398, partial [Trifolium medium]|nr:hypothetical protein [Trifolium medium]